MIKNIIIIGVGGIGSRHLESLLKIKRKLRVIVCDQSTNQLKKTKEKITIINKRKHCVELHNKIESFQFSFDLAIVATSADVRKEVINKLILKNEIRNLIIEKIAFNKLTEYRFILNQIRKKNIKAYVNFPRREMDSYKDLKQKIIKLKRFAISNIGYNWGLASNSLHMLDLLSYFSNERIFVLNSSLSNKIFKSSRNRFMEFKGILRFLTKKQNLLLLEDIDIKMNDKKLLGGIKIETEKKDFIIYEDKHQLLEIIKNKNNLTIKKHRFKILLQSDLTKRIVENIFLKKKINLPTLEESYQDHKIFINIFKIHLNKISKKSQLMIT